MNLLKVRHHHHEGSELHGEYPQPWVLRRTYRFLLGRPMDNRIYTDATFWRSATRGYPGSWLRLAGWQRLALRLAAIYGALLFSACSALYLLGADGALLHLLLWHLLLGALLAGPVVLRRTISAYGLSVPWREKVEHSGEDGELRVERRWVLREIAVGSKQWERDVVLPLARAVAPQIERHFHKDDAVQWCIVPRDYAKPEGSPVRIKLKAGYTGADHRAKQRLVRTITTRLALDEMTPSWELGTTDSPELVLRTPAAPPKDLDFSGVRHFLEGAPEYEPFLGIVAGGQGLHIKMIGDGPHTALSAGTGAGKTTLLKLLVAQFLYLGWSVVVLDYKRSRANEWLRDLPGVRYLSEIAAIHDFGVALEEEIDYRRNADPAEQDTAPRVAVFRNEWNATASLLSRHWQRERAAAGPEGRATMDTRSPAVEGYSQLSFMGRELGMFDFVETQRLSARVFGGSADVRENYRNILMARYSRGTVKMLFTDGEMVRTFPPAPKQVGRWVVYAGGDVHIAQVPLLTGQEARAFATSGRAPAASPFAVRGGVRQRDNSPNIHSTQGEQSSHELTHPYPLELPAAPVRSAGLTALAAMLDRYGITKKVLQNERSRDPQFPAAVAGDQFNGYTYDVDEMAEWAARRHARMSAEKVAK